MLELLGPPCRPEDTDRVGMQLSDYKRRYAQLQDGFRNAGLAVCTSFAQQQPLFAHLKMPLSVNLRCGNGQRQRWQTNDGSCWGVQTPRGCSESWRQRPT